MLLRYELWNKKQIGKFKKTNTVLLFKCICALLYLYLVTMLTRFVYFNISIKSNDKCWQEISKSKDKFNHEKQKHINNCEKIIAFNLQPYKYAATCNIYALKVISWGISLPLVAHKMKFFFSPFWKSFAW